MKSSSSVLSTNLPSKVNLKIALALLAIIIGGHIYIIYRPDSLLMFSWFHLLGLDKYVELARHAFSELYVADWVVYNLPTGLWLLSYMLIIDAVWGNERKDFACKVFLYSLPCIAVASEFLQLFQLLPGTFDFADILSYLFACVIFQLLK